MLGNVADTTNKFLGSAVSKTTGATMSAMSATTNMTKSAMSTTKDITIGAVNTTKDITVGAVSTTTSMTMNAANMTTHIVGNTAVKTSKVTTSLVHDGIALALGKDGETLQDKSMPELPPLFFVSSWSAPRLEDSYMSSSEQVEGMSAKVESVIQTTLEESQKRADVLKAKMGDRGQSNSSLGGMHLMYTRVLACLLFPQTPGLDEETEMWFQDDHRLLREWCTSCDTREQVTEQLHEAALAFLDSYSGKGSLMAGLLARMQIVNKHPFYDPQGFENPRAYESWKIHELESIESQKKVINRYTKSEVEIELVEFRDTKLAERAALGHDNGLVDEMREKVNGLMVDGTSKMMGGLNSMMKNPLTSMAKATGAMLSAPKSMAEMVTRTRGDLWCVITFAANEHSTPELLDFTAEQPQVKFNTAITWQVKPSEKGAVSVQVWRRKKFNMPGGLLSEKEEMLGTLIFSWEELQQTAEFGRSIEGWFTCDDGTYDQHGVPLGGLEVYMRLQVLTKPIDGTEEAPLFDPFVDLHKVYSDFYRALNPGLSMMPPPACDWILKEMRCKCAVGDRWHYLLRLAPGLNLTTPEGMARDSELEVREGRLVALLDCIKGGGQAFIGTLTIVDEGVHHAFRHIQTQVRNVILNFPYRLACGEEDQYQEPAELQLLIEIDEAISSELSKVTVTDLETLKSMPKSSMLSTRDVVKEGLLNFMQNFYGEAIQQALTKKPVPETHRGELQVKHVKKLCKKCLHLAIRLHENFSRVLPPGVEDSGLERIVDIFTVDVLGAVSAYHLRGESPNAFQDGTEEAELLKVHYRTIEMRKILIDLKPGLQLGGLATATAPLLAAWVNSTREVIFRWMESATKMDTWEPAGGAEVGHSASLVDVFSSAEGAVKTFADLRMGALPSVREAFLDMICEVCTGYIEKLKIYGEAEQQAAAEKLAASSREGGAMGRALGMMSFQTISGINFMKGMPHFGRSNSPDRVGGEDADKIDMDTMLEKSEGYLEKIEQVAEDLTSVTAWKKGLTSIGSKGFKASMSLTKKTANMATFGLVGRSDSSKKLDTSTTSIESSSEMSPSKLSSPGPKIVRVLSSKDFYDGQTLITSQACIRMYNACQVKLQMDSIISLLEQDEGWTGGEGMQSVIRADAPDWTLSPQMQGIYEKVRTAIDEEVEIELRPHLQWLGSTIAASLTDEGGTPPASDNAVADMFRDVEFSEGMKVVRGPHWKWGKQDGTTENEREKAVGVVVSVKSNGWCRVLWSNGHEDSYRSGAEGGQFDIQPKDFTVPDPALPPAVAAIEEGLDSSLAALRSSLNDRGFTLCLKVVWLACVEVIETCLRDDMTGNVDYVKRAKELLLRLRTYMHADGKGISQSVIERSSAHLEKQIEASLM